MKTIHHTLKRLMLGLVCATAFSLTATTGIAQANSFPTRTLRIIVPFPAGGGTDIIARTLAERLSNDLGQSVIVENKPGGGTIIGSQEVARSKADGYTLLLTSSAHAINTALMPELPYSTDTSFSSIAMVGSEPAVLIAPVTRPYHSVKEVIASSHAQKGGLTFGSSGTGTAVHLAGELFKTMTKADLLHVPYRGGAPAITDLVGGQLDLAFATIASVGDHIRHGRAQAIGVTSAERSPLFPEIPTLAEGGVQGYDSEVWYAVFAPANTPANIVETLNSSFNKALNDPIVQERFAPLGLQLRPMSPEQLTDYVKQEEARWIDVVKEANISHN